MSQRGAGAKPPHSLHPPLLHLAASVFPLFGLHSCSSSKLVPFCDTSVPCLLKVLQYLPNFHGSLCAHPVPFLFCPKVPWGVTNPGTTSGSALPHVKHRMSVKECV